MPAIRALELVGSIVEPVSDSRCDELSGAAATAPSGEPPANGAGFCTTNVRKSLLKKFPV